MTFVYAVTGIFVSATYMAVMCKGNVAVDCVLKEICTRQINTYIEQGQCDAYFQSDSVIFPVIYANNMKGSL